MPNTTQDLKLDLAKERVAHSIIKKELEHKVTELIVSQASLNKLADQVTGLEKKVGELDSEIRDEKVKAGVLAKKLEQAVGKQCPKCEECAPCKQVACAACEDCKACSKCPTCRQDECKCPLCESVEAKVAPEVVAQSISTFSTQFTQLLDQLKQSTSLEVKTAMKIDKFTDNLSLS